ncbi:MAG: CDP-alcohol phosphatidyltransferase family protein [Candidatus Hermodarchaeota archaeon]
MTSENFKEFKKIIQGKKLEKQKKKKDWWHAVFRFISKYITWILVKTKISANFITIAGFLIGLIGLFFIGIGNNLFIIIGFILLYIYYISDEVDGEVARYKKQTSLRGIYYDEIGHLFFLGWYFFSFGYSIYRINHELLYVFFGIIATFFLFGLRVIRKIAILASVKTHANKRTEVVQEITQNNLNKGGFFKSIRKLSLNLINGFSHPNIITTIFFIGFLLYIFLDLLWILEIIMIGYVAFMAIVFFSFIMIKAKSIDKDVLQIHHSFMN